MKNSICVLEHDTKSIHISDVILDEFYSSRFIMRFTGRNVINDDVKSSSDQFCHDVSTEESPATGYDTLHVILLGVALKKPVFPA